MAVILTLTIIGGDGLAMAETKKFDVNKSWIKFILAVIVLDLLILAAFLTSTPQTSPAAAWTTMAYELRYKIAARDRQEAALCDAPELVQDAEGPVRRMPRNDAELDVTLHRIHLTSDLLPGLACHDCHQRIDLTPRGNTVYISWVNVAFCKKCHSMFPGPDPNSPMEPQFFDEDCTTCHSGDNTPSHAEPYLTQIIAPSECKGCHGGQRAAVGAGPRAADVAAEPRRGRLAVGAQSCYKCHDFGLKFCDTCHKLMPPSHKPLDQWLVNHPATAQADTRACFTCHTAASARRAT